MKAIVKEKGLLIPKKFLKGIIEAEITLEKNKIVIHPLRKENDSLWDLGSNPGHSGLKDGAVNHDKYLYGEIKG